MTPFKKKLLTLRQQLIGAKYFDALKALEFAMAYHNGLRKDGVTPEFQHQVEIALYALTLPNLLYRQEIIATIMLHDVREDYGITSQEINELFSTPDFATRVNQAVDCMTKEWRGQKKDELALFDSMAANCIASIAKGCDRIHNINSMPKVFSVKKQREYVSEVKELFLPMLKKARKNFPQQHDAYMNIQFVLQTQIDLIEHCLDSLEGETES